MARVEITNATHTPITGVYFLSENDNDITGDNFIAIPIAPGSARTVLFPVGEGCTGYAAAVTFDEDVACVEDGEQMAIPGQGRLLGDACPGDVFRWVVSPGNACSAS